MGCPLGRVVLWDGLSVGTGCPLGRVVRWDGLSWDGLSWDGLSAGMGRPLGRVVRWDELSGYPVKSMPVKVACSAATAPQRK